MTIATAIFLIAIGAILRYAINVHSDVINIQTVGLILMIAGIAGLILGFLQEAIWSDRARRRRGVVVDDPDVVDRRQVVDRRDVPPRY